MAGNKCPHEDERHIRVTVASPDGGTSGGDLALTRAIALMART